MCNRNQVWNKWWPMSKLNFLNTFSFAYLCKHNVIMYLYCYWLEFKISLSYRYLFCGESRQKFATLASTANVMQLYYMLLSYYIWCVYIFFISYMYYSAGYSDFLSLFISSSIFASLYQCFNLHVYMFDIISLEYTFNGIIQFFMSDLI